MRLESDGRAALCPKAPAELAVHFECCVCESIHIGVQLPPKSSTGGETMWSMKDPAVEHTFDELSSWVSESVGDSTVTPRSVRTVVTDWTGGTVQLAATEEADRRGVEQTNSGAAVPREGGELQQDEGGGQVLRGPALGTAAVGGSQAMREAAIGRAIDGQRKTTSSKKPL